MVDFEIGDTVVSHGWVCQYTGVVLEIGNTGNLRIKLIDCDVEKYWNQVENHYKTDSSAYWCPPQYWELSAECAKVKTPLERKIAKMWKRQQERGICNV